MSDTYYSNLMGSGAANIATALVFFLLWVVRNKCKRSRCVGHSLCCDIEINDDESKSEEEPEEDLERQTEKLNKLREEIEIQMQKLHRRLNKGVPGSD